jgi:hypothetical protein
MRAILMVVVVLLAGGSWGTASEEEFLPWSEVRIVAADGKETGRVVFSAKTAGQQFQEVLLEAFGKQFKVGNDDMKKLNGFPLSSLVTTHEAGYERLGGHTVHFKFSKTYYDKPGEKSASLIEEKIVVSISRGLGLKFRAPTQRVLRQASAD